jgi:hypothetical protein
MKIPDSGVLATVGLAIETFCAPTTTTPRCPVVLTTGELMAMSWQGAAGGKLTRRSRARSILISSLPTQNRVVSFVDM